MEPVDLCNHERVGNVWNTYRILGDNSVYICHHTGASVQMGTKVWLQVLALKEDRDHVRRFWEQAASMAYGLYWREARGD